MVRGEPESVRITLEAVETGVLGYVCLTDIGPGAAVKQVQVDPGAIMADHDSQGRLLGVEFVNAERANGATMRRLAKQLDAPELAGLDLAEMCKAQT